MRLSVFVVSEGVEWGGGVSLCSLSWLRTHRNLPASASRVCGGGTTTPSLSHVNGAPRQIELHLDLGERGGLSNVWDENDVTGEVT